MGLTSILLGVCHLAPAESVDPRSPEEWRGRHDAEKPRASSWWPPTHIAELEGERAGLIDRISVLPEHKLIFRSDRMGFHSRFDLALAEEGALNHWIEVRLARGSEMLDAIALMPAFNPEKPDGSTYAFPKRFKIEVKGERGGKFEEIVNWMDEDFPDPGPYPVFFSEIKTRMQSLRITVPSSAGSPGEGGFALGEIFLFRTKEDGTTGQNMSVWGEVMKFSISDQLSIQPVWDKPYLYDQIVGLGLPLSGGKVDAEDFRAVLGADAEQIQMILDLGKEQDTGRVDFWPGSAPHGLALPSYGFPREILMEFSGRANFKKAKTIRIINARNRVHEANPLRVLAPTPSTRYIRITMTGLSEHEGGRFLGLGEIVVSQNGNISTENATITATGLTTDALEQLPRLLDGFSNQRRILPESEWMRGLAERRPLDRRLATVESDLASLRERWRRLWVGSVFGMGAFLVTGMAGGIVFQRVQRLRSLDGLKRRIARDLHDEVGSNIGGVLLIAERLRRHIRNPEAQAEFVDLSLQSREAAASLRDVVWMLDRRSVRLPDLAQRLAERARRVLADMELSVVISPDCPDVEVSLNAKRHLMMLFKEVVHNCALHAEAGKVEIEMNANDGQLTLRVQDDGRGFDLSARHAGWGIDSLRKRAGELGGTMDIRSSPGAGTAILVMVPLDSLRQNKDYFNGTSN